LGVHSAEAAMIGDNMNTDIIAGIETGLMSVLVLSGVSTKEGIKNYAYQPNLILNNVGEIVPKKV
jgi:NagD protein